MPSDVPDIECVVECSDDLPPLRQGSLPEAEDAGGSYIQERSVDPLSTLGQAHSPPGSERRVVRRNYASRMGTYNLVACWIPNLEPILRWRSTPSASPSPPQTPDLRRGRTTATPESPESPPPGMQQQRPCGAQGHLAPIIEPAPSRGFFGAGSVKGSVVNIAAATLGAGALSLPRAFYYSGLTFGVCLMVVMVALAAMSIRCIIQTVHLSGKNTFEEISKKAYGSAFALFMEVNIVLFCFGTAMGYMMTVGDISSEVIDRLFGAEHHHWYTKFLTNPNFVLTLITVVLLFPLSMIDKINELRFASLMGVCCIIFLVGVVTYIFARHGLHPTLQRHGSAAVAFEPKDGITGCFKMLSLAIFAFCCQPNVPAIYCELERKSYKRMDKVAFRGMMLCLSIYIVMGIAGFLAFGNATEGNVMSNLQPYLCKNDPVVILGFVAMAFAVTMAFPLNIFPIRFTVETVLFYHKPHLNTKFVKFLIGVVAVGLSLIGAILVPSINVVFELVGATTGSFVCFIGPGMLYTKLKGGPFWQRSSWHAITLIVLGTCFFVLGTYSSVVDIVAAMGQPAAVKKHCPRHPHGPHSHELLFS